MTDVSEGWQPIETAPRDGTMILLYGQVHNGRFASAGFLVLPEEGETDPDWSYPRYICMDLDGETSTCRPTHWMPLPAPPETTHD